MTKRRTEITVETERLLVAHLQTTTRVWCARCGMEVETAAGTEAASTNGAAQSARPRQAGADAAGGEKKSAKNFQDS